MTIATSLISAVLTSLVLGYFARSAFRSDSRSLAEGQSLISPDRRLVWSLVAGCGVMAGLALYGATFHAGGFAAWTLAIVFGCFAVLSATSLTPAVDVTWTDDTVSGPGSYGIPPFGPQQVTIGYDEIIDAGVDAMGSFFIRDEQGQKLRWSHYYAGFADLNDAIARHRPDLFPEPDEI